MLGVTVGSGVNVNVAVSVGGSVAVDVGTGDIVTVGGNGVAITVFVDTTAVFSADVQPIRVATRIARQIRTGCPLSLKCVNMGAIILPCGKLTADLEVLHRVYSFRF